MLRLNVITFIPENTRLKSKSIGLGKEELKYVRSDDSIINRLVRSLYPSSR